MFVVLNTPMIEDKLGILLAQLKQLEEDVLGEIQKKEASFGYRIQAGQVHFRKAVAARHGGLMNSLTRYLYEAKPLSLFTAPVIWFCLFPVLLLDATATFYQFVCFPVYGIPKVRREEYVVMDRHRLRYLNSIERWNCVYCEYVNGLIAYVQEIAGRTEQHWCPIKHALRLKTIHSRYRHFLDYGDAEQYRARLDTVRNAFQDLKKP